MSTAADRLDAKFAQAGQKIAAKTFSDDYTIKRMVTESDSRGGQKPTTTPPTYTTVEAGKCAFWPNQTQSREYVSGQVVVSSADYLAEFLTSTVLVETDEITINSRTFHVTGVKRGGHWSTSVIAELEARA